jgi:hypothetical protein
MSLTSPAVGLPDLHQLVGVRIRKRPQQDRVQHAEHDGICCNAQRQRQNRGYRKSRRPAQDPQAVADILE